MPKRFETKSTLHTAVIMDGNGRWAEARGLPRLAGHRAGIEALRRVVEAAPGEGVGTLTAFAFSSDNWRRPPEEVEGLMRLMAFYLSGEIAALVKQGVRLQVIGRRDRIPAALAAAIGRAEMATAAGRRLLFRVAVDYSGREAILAAARATAEPSRESVARSLGPAVDLLIRTGGERRLSDFLLWESAYAELVFRRTMWPDFSGSDLASAIREFRGRDRRFGAIPAPPQRAHAGWLD